MTELLKFLNESSMPLWMQAIILVLAIVFTYLAIGLKQKSDLKRIAEASVANTLQNQDLKLNNMDTKLNLSARQIDRLTLSYHKMRNGISVIQAQAEGIHYRLRLYLDSKDMDPLVADDLLSKLERSFADLFLKLAELQEVDDPMEEDESPSGVRKPSRTTIKSWIPLIDRFRQIEEESEVSEASEEKKKDAKK